MPKKLKSLATLSDEDIDVDFRKQTEAFCDYIYSQGPAKAIETGETLNGSCKRIIYEY